MIGRIVFTVAMALLLYGCGRPGGQPAIDVAYERTLSFEAPGLAGWGGGPPETLFADSLVVHEGRYAGRIERDTESSEDFSAFTTSVPVTFAGEELELRGWLRTDEVTGFAGLWLREDGRSGSLQFDNMQSRSLSGTTEWEEYRIILPLDGRARTVVLGALLTGEGTVWVDDLRLLVDGFPASRAPALVSEPSPVELDTEFDGGSGVPARDVTPQQIDNLTLLAKVWGFAKYHHPRITAGEVNWDYQLFRVLPSVLEAATTGSACDSISNWLAGLGDPIDSDERAAFPDEAHLLPELDWIRDRALLGADLSARLRLIHERRSTAPEQYYVSHVAGVGNPDFSSENDYPDDMLPDAGFRLLALLRFWNIIEYWFPYRDAIGESWDAVLREFVPRFISVDTVDDYRLLLLELSARVNDGHANLWRHKDIAPPRGSHAIPVVMRFVEGEAVVTGYTHEHLGPKTGLVAGDVIERIDGASVDSLVAAWSPYYPASNEAARLRDIARTLTRGLPGTARIEGTREGKPLSVAAERVSLDDLDLSSGRTHDLPGETFQHIAPEVSYLKLSSVAQPEDVADYMAQAEGSELLVVDIRNYPSSFVVFTLGGRLITEPTAFARFTTGDPANPGAFRWTSPIELKPLEPSFSGDVVILVDEVSMSQAEYTAMALGAAPRALVVGSTTAGADGNVSAVPLPGGVSSMISGIGVFYPDRTPTQRVGVTLDLRVEPTIAGVRADRDEVLEAAVSHALGREFRLPR
jgi:C-terminal processing protease CtpA/Prc